MTQRQNFLEVMDEIKMFNVCVMQLFMLLLCLNTPLLSNIIIICELLHIINVFMHFLYKECFDLVLDMTESLPLKYQRELLLHYAGKCFKSLYNLCYPHLYLNCTANLNKFSFEDVFFFFFFFFFFYQTNINT